MSKTNIAEDVMAAAVKCAETVCRNLDYDDCSVEIEVIARAILAERERCADVAEELPVSVLTGTSAGADQAEITWQTAARVHAQSIAAAIRSGE